MVEKLQVLKRKVRIQFVLVRYTQNFSEIINYFFVDYLSIVSRQRRAYAKSYVFLVSKEVERSLMNRKTAKCLAWCHDNRSKLRKLHSTMEFNLRIQEFVELVKADRRLEAVKHARKYFSNYEEGQLISIQHCMALLAFPITTELSPYKELLEEERWSRLVEQFRQENYKLFQLASQSVFTVALQAGLSALKTPYPFNQLFDF
ncbi:unnamed protein product [Nesidiocoris tenuis]|uniref:CTLH domain-containing protein n=1 Tax=Nesidiocoris tenuis TaxID=355587 RepID=A0A6H5GPM3_9HEMI|nr:unnamed protein product [Nesidiocoris tenuis]